MPFFPTDEQDAVLRHDAHRHARVLAGPGTGKSATVVALLTRLLEQEEPPRVKLLTFTRAATSELASKVLEHPAIAALQPSTVHSFSISVLLRNPDAGGLPTPLRIADDWENHEVVWPTLARRLGVTPTKVSQLFRELAAGWESLTAHHDERVTPEERARFTGAWQEHRKIFGYTLLAELPYALRNAIQEHRDLEGLDYDLLIVDEYQDLNACDLSLLRLIASRGTAILAAGDDDQSIYSMRMAAPEGIRRFPDEYTPADRYSLSIAQRFGAEIINWASHVIEGDPDRPPRARLRPVATAAGAGVGLLAFDNERAEAEGVARIVSALIDNEGIPPSDILILVRGDYNRTFSRPIRAALERRDIACSNPEAIRELFVEPSNRKALAWFRLLTAPTDSLAWATLLRLEAGIGDSFVDFVYTHARTATVTFGVALLDLRANECPNAPAAARTRARRLIDEFQLWAGGQQIPEQRPEIGWGGWLGTLLLEHHSLAPTDEFRELLIDVDGMTDEESSFERYLSQLQPLGKDLALARSGGVRIMTMGGSKGLTVRATIVAGVEDGIIPRPNTDPAEERRLLYVAMTRAREHLYCTFARRRRGPTARAGAPRVNERRQISPFLRGGPMTVQDGMDHIGHRWG
jgi:DNA helicase II / ATP-dependent DNA helicase PcrA